MQSTLHNCCINNLNYRIVSFDQSRYSEDVQLTDCVVQQEAFQVLKKNNFQVLKKNKTTGDEWWETLNQEERFPNNEYRWEWIAVDDDAIAAQVYMKAFLTLRGRINKMFDTVFMLDIIIPFHAKK